MTITGFLLGLAFLWCAGMLVALVVVPRDGQPGDVPGRRWLATATILAALSALSLAADVSGLLTTPLILASMLCWAQAAKVFWPPEDKPARPLP